MIYDNDLKNQYVTSKNSIIKLKAVYLKSC